MSDLDLNVDGLSNDHSLEDFCKYFGKLDRAYLASLNEDDFELNYATLGYLLGTYDLLSRNCINGKADIEKVSKKEKVGNLSFCADKFSFKGDELKVLCEKISHTSALLIEGGHKDRHLLIEMNFPNLYVNKKEDE